MHDSLERLLRLVGNRDPQAFDALYREVEGRVFAFAMSRLNDPHASADVLNEVMLEVWRKAATFERRSRPLTWIMGIAHHKICDARRREARRIAEPLENLPVERAEDPGMTADRAVALARSADNVHHCIGTLSDAHRQVVHLAFFEGLSYGEIATIAECPEGTVKTRMFHAKRLLRDCLEGLLA